MHKAEAKSILSSQNGMNLYRGCSMAVYTVIPGVPAME